MRHSLLVLTLNTALRNKTHFGIRNIFSVFSILFFSLFLNAQTSTSNEPNNIHETCTWTVTVYGNGMADEISWQLRTASGNVLLSGGGYTDWPFLDVQTVSSEDPVEFYIEAIGNWNDNISAFMISNGNGMILNSGIAGGEEATYSDLLCSTLPLPVPDNDECEDITPTVLTNGVPVTFNGTTEGATASIQELSLLSFGAVWEAVTLTEECNNLTVDFCGTAAGIMDGNTFIVYLDSCLATDFSVANNYEFTTCEDGNPTLFFYNLPAGTYYIPVVVDPSYNSLGEYQMNVISENCPPAPENDDCEDAVELSCGDSYSGSTLSANNSGYNASGDVFFSYTGSGQAEYVTVSLCGSSFDTYLRIFSDCSLDNQIAYNDEFCGPQSQLTFESDGTSTYIIMVEGFSGDIGDYEINISCENVPPPPVDCEDFHINTNDYEAVYFFASDVNQRLAIDIPVGEVELAVTGLQINVLDYASFFNFIIYEDNDGLPGTQLTTRTGVITEEEIIGNYWETDAIRYSVEFDSPLNLNPNTTYWVEVQADAQGWEATSVLGSKIGYDDVNLNNLTEGNWAPADGFQFVFALLCGELGSSDLESQTFTYFPNPVNEALNIDSKKVIKSVEVYNLSGQKIKSQAVQKSNVVIKTDDLSPGTYLFRAELEDRSIETFKVIKK